MKYIALFLFLFCLAVTAGAQETYYSIFSYDHFIPDVRINDRSVSLQTDLYPQWYHTHSALNDMRWVRENDSGLATFWASQGDTILHILCELSGIEWQEQEFDIRLLRYFPSAGSSSPLILPIGGILRGQLIEASPIPNIERFYLTYLLSKRMLDQAVYPRLNFALRIASHPLMRHSPYRRDNLALLLAYATCESIMGIDSARSALESAFIKNRMPGLEIFKRYFLNKWTLTPDNTLADLISRESYSSPLVIATRPPKPKSNDLTLHPVKFIEGLPLKGKLGFSVRINDKGGLVVDSIDVYRLAYACGLRTGDLIRSVNGARVRTHKNLVEKIYETLNEGGATLQVIRDNKNISLIIQPSMLPEYEYDTLYKEEEYQMIPDSLPVTAPPDSILQDSIK